MPHQKEWLGHPGGRGRAESIEAGNLSPHSITAQPYIGRWCSSSPATVRDWHERKARLYQRSVVPYLGGLPLPTDAEIQQAVRQMRDQGMWRRDFYIESNDTVRLAFAWLDAQSRTKRPQRPRNSIQPAVCAWAGRYVSRTAIDCAAILHPDIRGEYPEFNISRSWTRPAPERLVGIEEAMIHSDYRTTERPELRYRRREVRP